MTMKRSADEAEKQIHQHNLVTVHWHLKSNFFQQSFTINTGFKMTWLEILLKHALLHHPTNVAIVQDLQFIHSKLNEILGDKTTTAKL